MDLLVVPGGAKGADTISSNNEVQKLLKAQLDKGKLVGMICAGTTSSIAPLFAELTGSAGSLAAKRSGYPRLDITSHPSVKGELENG